MYLLGFCLYKNAQKRFVCSSKVVCAGLCRFVYSRFPFNKGLCRFVLVCVGLCRFACVCV